MVYGRLIVSLAWSIHNMGVWVYLPANPLHHALCTQRHTISSQQICEAINSFPIENVLKQDSHIFVAKYWW